MAHCLVVFASLNQVALLQRALNREKVYMEMMRTPQSLSSTGCSFAVRCNRADVPLVLQTCSKWSIEPGGVFDETEEILSGRPRVFTEDELEQ